MPIQRKYLKRWSSYLLSQELGMLAKSLLMLMEPAVPAAQVDGAEEVEDQIEEDFVDN